MEEEYIPQHVQQPLKKQSLGNKFVRGVGIMTKYAAKGALHGVKDLRNHMQNRQLELQRKGGNKRPLPNKNYKIVMPKEDKRKLGLNIGW